MELHDSKKFIVFSDLKGFSSLEKAEQKRYLKVHVHLLGQDIQPLLEKADVSNTWGDAIIAVFAKGKDAVDFMLHYREESKRNQHSISKKKLLPRIAGHYGNVTIFKDPLLENKTNIISPEVNTAARIEPVTRPGEIFVSKEFEEAFIKDCGDQTGVRFERLGMIQLAKGHGEKELFRLINHEEKSHIIDQLFELDLPKALPAEQELTNEEKQILSTIKKMVRKGQIQDRLELEWEKDHTGSFVSEAAKLCKRVGLYETGLKWLEKAEKETFEISGITLYPFKSKLEMIKLKADLLTRLDRYGESAEILYSLWKNIEGQDSKEASQILSMLAAQFKRRALIKNNKVLQRTEADVDLLKRAASLYLEAFRYNLDDYYPAVNAAYLLAMLGGSHTEQGRRLARYIKEIWELEKGTDHWLDFTLAETELIMGIFNTAAEDMEKALQQHDEKIGVFDIAAARIQIHQYLTFTDQLSEGQPLLETLDRYMVLKQENTFQASKTKIETNENYYPQPLNTDHVTLPQEIMELREQLAENIHEVWALQRVNEGWIYGTERDDQKKHHPNLIPYSQLTEDEKDYDRNTAMETLKTIISLGYEIRKK